MVFIILLVMVFGMVLGAMQFGSAPNGGNVTTASPRAVLYAQNMETWHQAAMLAVQQDKTNIANDPNCSGSTQPCAVSLNGIFWSYANSAPSTDPVNGTLHNNWPEYQPVVAEGNPAQPVSGGWQSFLIENINGTCTNPVTQNCSTTGSESYVLTVFRGFGYGDGTYAGSSSNISSNQGSLDNTQLVNALAKTIQDRMGVGNLLCNTTTCSFTRAAAYNAVTGGATTSDLALGFPISAFTAIDGSALPSGTANQTLNGLPAIMTRVGGAGAAQTCQYENIAWGSNNYVQGQNTSDPTNYQCVGSLNQLQSGAPAEPAIFNTSASQPGYNGSLSATCNGTSWNINPGYTCSSTNAPCTPNTLVTWTGSASTSCTGSVGNNTTGTVQVQSTNFVGDTAWFVCTAGAWQLDTALANSCVQGSGSGGGGGGGSGGSPCSYKEDIYSPPRIIQVNMVNPC